MRRRTGSCRRPAVAVWRICSRASPLGLVISGHVHQYRMLRLGGADHLWVPTTWAVLPDRVQPSFGKKRCGIVVLELGPGGASEHELVAPPGISQLTLLEDLPDPYHR